MFAHGSLRARHGAGSARLFVLALVAALGMAHALPASAPAQVAPAQVAPALLSGPPLTPVATALASPHVPGVVLVGFYSGVSRARQHAIERTAGAYQIRHLGPPIKPVGHGSVTGAEFLEPIALRVPDAELESALGTLLADPAVAYAEPDYLQTADATPNDPSFSLQWGDSNTGQAIPTQGADKKRILEASWPPCLQR